MHASQTPKAIAARKAKWRSMTDAQRIASRTANKIASAAWRARNPEKRKQVTAAWDKRNPEYRREATRRWKAKQTARLPRGTIKRIGEAQRWRCAICRRGVKHAYHVDHIKPLARGGAHEPRNIQLLCGGCNVRKSARDPIDYMQSLGRLL